ncbi:MAG TPA: rod shape-determining protein RodA [Patescibacteria group bacterium]|nr:rod shape-determining protein RodA [Patescibacteria group bacterium]
MNTVGFSSTQRSFGFARITDMLRGLDLFLIAAAALLVLFGVLALYSLDGGIVGFGSKSFRQIGWVAVSLFAFIVFSFLDYNQLRKNAGLLFIGSIVLLITVLIIGKAAHGTTGWIQFGQFGFQPVELVKIVLIVVLARFFSATQNLSILWMVVGSFILALIPFALVLLQPDLGSGILFIVVWFGLIVVRGLSWRWITAILVTALIIAAAGWTALKPYQQDRVLTFLEPGQRSSAAGYQAIQSVVAVGSGEILGRGLGFGSQSQLRFLPEASTDFVFAAIAEEFGFIGVMIFFAAFVFLCYRLYVTAATSRDDFAYLVAAGMFILLSAEVFINSAMNVGLFPITGIPFPLVSYGGSSLLATFIGLGIIQSVFRRRKALSFS